MSKIAILYFSGTQATEAIARLYRDYLTEMDTQVDLLRMEDFLLNQSEFNPQPYAMIGIGYPVHAFNAPRIVFDFLKTLPVASNKPVFLFRTSGAYSSVNNASSMSVRNRLVDKGYQVFHDTCLVLKSNFITRYPDEYIKILHGIAKEKVEKYAQEIVHHQKRLPSAAVYSQMLSTVAWGEHFGAKMMGKFHLYASSDCILCNKCVMDCPTRTIRRQGNTIRFGSNCILCMRCMYSCPEQAIKARGFAFINKGPSTDLFAILADDSLSEHYEKNMSDAFYRHFRNYIEAE